MLTIINQSTDFTRYGIGLGVVSKEKFNYQWLDNREEIEKYLDAWKDTDLYTAVYMTLMLGLRRSELLGLRWADINFTTGVLPVQRVIIIGANNEVLVKNRLKNSEDKKYVLLPAKLLIYLKEFKGTASPDSYIILDSKGKYYHPGSFSRKFCELKKHLPVNQGIRFHDLRHSLASYLYAQDVDIKVISDRLGHSDINTTLNIYTHTKVENQAKATVLLDF